MTRDQMIAWLTLEGWSSHKCKHYGDITNWEGPGEIFNPSEHWRQVKPASWHRYTDREIQNFYEAVANQVS